jgi:hypothetical protein
LRARLARRNPDTVLIAEASGRDGYYAAHGFDAEYDWTSRLGQWAWDGVFAPDGGLPDLARLRAALTNGGQGYPAHTLLLRFLDNNDTGRRFITRYGLGETRAAIEMLFTLPGIPLIYDGEEVGAAFEPYDEGPVIRWSDPDGLTPLYTRMSQERRNVRALMSPRLRMLATDHDRQVLTYLRPGGKGMPDALVAINFADAPVRVRLRAAGALVRFSSADARNLATGRRWRVHLPAEPLELPAYGGAIVLSALRSSAAGAPARTNRQRGPHVASRVAPVAQSAQPPHPADRPRRHDRGGTVPGLGAGHPQRRARPSPELRGGRGRDLLHHASTG